MNPRSPVTFLICCTVLLAAVAAPPALAGEEPGAKSPGRTRSGQARKYVYLRLHGPMPERQPLLYVMPPKNLTHRQVLGLIEKAKNDNTVKGLFIHMGRPQVGWARAQEIRLALHSCRMAGKRVVCYMEGGANVEYYIASAADRIGIVPTGSIFLIGLRAEVMFFKGLLDKLDIKANFVQVGKYKGADEPFTQTEMSDPFRKTVELMLDDLYGQIVSAIAKGRDMKPELVKALIDRGPYTAKVAQEAGLVDDVVYYDEFIERLRAEAPTPLYVVRGYTRKKTKMPDPMQMLNLLKGMGAQQPQQMIPSGDVIVLLYANGPIVMGDADGDLFGDPVVAADKMVQMIRVARNTQNVKAVVLRVSSPGGSALASDIIWHELERTDKVKPVIVSLADVAASGGYYIAVGGRKIVADPSTITGSIGVVGGKLNLRGLYNKLGLSVSIIQRGRNAGLYSQVSDWNEQERERVRSMMRETYKGFLERVAKGRNTTVSEIDKVAQGQVWSGARAKEVGLVDELGGLDVAIDIARKEAKIPEGAPVKLVELPPSKSIFEQLFGVNPFAGARSPLKALKAAGLPVEIPAAVKAFVHILSEEKAVWMTPYTIKIK